LDTLFAGVPEFLVMSLLMGMVCLISKGQFEEPVRPLTRLLCHTIKTVKLL